MGLLDMILGLFGGAQRVHYGNLTGPDDLDGYHRVEHEIDQAERRGGDAAVKETLATFGFGSVGQWENAKTAILQKHGNSPEFKMAVHRVGFEMAVRDMTGKGYTFPAQYLAPPHGITLDRYAAIHARMRNGEPADAVLGAYQLDAARWQEVQGAWNGRMGPQADAMAGQILRSQYDVMVQCAASYYRGSN